LAVIVSSPFVTHRQHDAWIPAFAGMTVRFFVAIGRYVAFDFKA
jgi:hypothetical protein